MHAAAGCCRGGAATRVRAGWLNNTLWSQCRLAHSRVACRRIQADGHAQVVVLEHKEGRETLLPNLQWTEQGRRPMGSGGPPSVLQASRQHLPAHACKPLSVAQSAHNPRCTRQVDAPLTASIASAHSLGHGEVMVAWSHSAQSGWESWAANVSTSASWQAGRSLTCAAAGRKADKGGSVDVAQLCRQRRRRRRRRRRRQQHSL